jgi:hypothetical protein
MVRDSPTFQFRASATGCEAITSRLRADGRVAGAFAGGSPSTTVTRDRKRGSKPSDKLPGYSGPASA